MEGIQRQWRLPGMVWNLTVWFLSAVIFIRHWAVGGAMPDQKLLSLARELRARAEEVLAKAETFQDAKAREAMRGVAAGYVDLAQRLEREAGAADEA